MTLQRRILILAAFVVLLAAVAVHSFVRASSRADEKNQPQAGGPQITRGAVSLAPAGAARGSCSGTWPGARTETNSPRSRPQRPRGPVPRPG